MSRRQDLAAVAALTLIPIYAQANVNPVNIPSSVQYAANGMPILNSNTGAAGAAFIDFDGGFWANRGTMTAYDRDGNPATFNAQEAKDIYNAWLDVSTHFAMFDINVTTIQPNKSATPTAHVLVSPSMSGGAANVNVYGNTSSNAFGANEESDARTRTTGITHELGHIMGASHQSSYDANGVQTAQYRGTDGFNRAPIMGIDFAGKFSHWALGTSSAGSTVIQDDLQLISTNIKNKAIQFTGNYTGDGFRVDEHGNTRAAATALNVASTTPSGSNFQLSFSATGIIERYSDADMFAFNWAGSPGGQSVTFTAEAVKNVAGSPLYGSSLGMIMSVYNSAGVLLGQNTMTDVADVQATLSLTNLNAAGVYYVGIQSFGGYEDLGAYTLQFSGVSSSSGFAYWDNNGATAGFGTASGTWAAPTTGNASQGWSTVSTGTAVPTDYTTATLDSVFFGTDTVGLGAGTVTVSGTVSAGGINFGAASGAITLSGGTITLGGAAPIITVANTSDTISSVLSGTAGMTKAGTGTLVLTGSNNYTGTTNISAGTLALSGSGSLSSSTAVNTSATGATLDISGISASGTTVGSIAGVTGSSIVLGSKNLNAGGDDTSTTFAGVLSGTGGSLTKAGTGSLTLTGANTLTGGINLNAGTLVLGNDAALGGAGSVLTIAGGTTINVNAARTTTNNNAQVWNGDWTYGGGNTWNTGTGSVTLGAAATQLSNSGASTITVGGAVTGNSNLTLRANAAGGITFTNVNNAGTITNSGSGAGTTTLSTVGTNVAGLTQSSTTSALTVSTLNVGGGATTLSNTLGTKALTVTNQVTGTGDLVLNNNSTMAGGIALAAGANNVGTITNSGTNATGTTTISGAIGTNVTGVTQSGAGTLVLSAANTYTGPTTISAGTLSLSGSGSLADTGTVDLTGSGASFNISGITASSETIASFSGVAGSSVVLGVKSLVVGGDNSSKTFAGIASGTGGLTKNGTGTLTLTGANTYTGATTINGGSLVLSGAGDLSSSTAVNTAASGTVFDFSGITAAGETVGSIAGAAGSSVVMGTKNLTVGGNNSTTTFSGVIGGSGSLTKTGTGTLTLNTAGTNTYTGGTAVTGGILQVSTAGATSAVAGGNVTLSNGGRLSVSTVNMSSANELSVGTGGGQIAVSGNNNITYTGKLTGSGTLTAVDPGGGGGKNLNFNSTANDITGGITVQGAVVVSVNSLGSSSNNIAFNTGSGTFAFGAGGTSALSLGSRAIEINSASALTATIQNNNTTNPITVSSDLVATGAGAKTLTLGSVAGPNNVFAGNISNGTGGGTVAVAKTGVGTWSITGNMSHTGGVTVSGNSSTLNLSGTNTYSGTTTIGSGNPNSTLVIQGTQALSPNTTVNLVSNSTPAATLKLLDDTAGTINLPNTLSQDSANATVNFVVFVGNNNTANGGTSTGTTTGSTISLNKISASSLSNSKTIYGLKAEGANGYTLGINNVEVPAFPAATFTSATSWKWQLTANSAPILITGNVQQLAGSTSTTLTSPSIELSGTNTGSIVSGSIKDSLDSTPRAFAVSKTGTGTWALSGANTYSGATSVSAGTLQIGNGGTTGSLNPASSIAVSSGATLRFNRSNTITQGTDFASTISGAGSVVQAGSGTLVLSGTNTYSGTTAINSGTLQTGVGAGLPASSVLQLRGGVFQSSGTFSRTVGTAAGNVNWATSSGGFAANGGTLNLQLNGGTGSVTWNGSSMVQTGQTLVFGSTTADGLVDLQNALNLGSSSNGQRTIQVIDNTNSTTDRARISGAITNSSAGWGIIKSGDGVLELTGANTYTGATSVNGGTLRVNNATGSGTGTGSVTVGSSATLGGSGKVSGSVTVNTGGTLAAGSSIESLATGALTLNSGSAFDYEIDNDAAAAVAGDLTAVTGNLTIATSNDVSLNLSELGAGSWTLGEKLTLISYTGAWNGGLFEFAGDLVDDSIFSFSGATWQINYNDTVAGSNFTSDLTSPNFVTITAVVPEPATLGLLAMGVLGLTRRRRVA